MKRDLKATDVVLHRTFVFPDQKSEAHQTHSLGGAKGQRLFEQRERLLLLTKRALVTRVLSAQLLAQNYLKRSGT